LASGFEQEDYENRCESANGEAIHLAIVVANGFEEGFDEAIHLAIVVAIVVENDEAIGEESGWAIDSTNGHLDEEDFAIVIGCSFGLEGCGCGCGFLVGVYAKEEFAIAIEIEIDPLRHEGGSLGYRYHRGCGLRDGAHRESGIQPHYDR
jgi:hypothetical protein